MTRTASVLKDEIGALEYLINIAEQKRVALLKDDLVALQSVINEEEAASKHLCQLEETRLQQAGLFTNDEEAKDRKKMRQLLQMLKTKNEFNQTVLNDALAYTRFNIQLIAGIRQSSSFYGAEGRLQDVNYRRIIDRKG
ncbi:MAG TPA: flagellar protein FlgN [Bacillota bacterium]|nr:flagellar protein FlgN [Bacillota bacterium]